MGDFLDQIYHKDEDRLNALKALVGKTSYVLQRVSDEYEVAYTEGSYAIVSTKNGEVLRIIQNDNPARKVHIGEGLHELDRFIRRLSDQFSGVSF